MKIHPGVPFGILAGVIAYGAIKGFQTFEPISFLLFYVTVLAVFGALADTVYFAPKRKKEASIFRLEAECEGQPPALIEKTELRILRKPVLLSWASATWVVLLVLFLVRAFVGEHMRIPSGSMMPTFQAGDHILVNKYQYGLRLPLLNTKLTEGEPVARGDVVVFRFPLNPASLYIKRVVGVPGDTVAYRNKRLSVNGIAVPVSDLPDFFDKDGVHYSKQYLEQLGAVPHNFLNIPGTSMSIQDVQDYPYRDFCDYTVDGFTCKVPEGNYLMLGDNRDNSLDSRYWGFLPDEHVYGKAVYVVGLNKFSAL